MLLRASCVPMGLPTMLVILCSSLAHLWESHLTNSLAQMHAASADPVNGRQAQVGKTLIPTVSILPARSSIVRCLGVNFRGLGKLSCFPGTALAFERQENQYQINDLTKASQPYMVSLPHLLGSLWSTRGKCTCFCLTGSSKWSFFYHSPCSVCTALQLPLLPLIFPDAPATLPPQVPFMCWVQQWPSQ